MQPQGKEAVSSEDNEMLANTGPKDREPSADGLSRLRVTAAGKRGTHPG